MLLSLTGSGEGILSNYFAENWIPIITKWTNLRRRDLPTLGSNTTNCL